MKNTIIKFLATFILLHCSIISFSQKNDTGDLTDSTSAINESADANEKDFATDSVVTSVNFLVRDDSLKAYRTNKDFAYINYLDSVLRTRKDLSVDTISAGSSKGRYRKNNTESQQTNSIRLNIFSNPFVNIILCCVAIFFIGFIIYKLFFTGGIFKGRSTQNIAATDDAKESELEPSGYDALISQALKNKNYRLAIRYLYLQTLQHLSVAGVINFSGDKTNYEYVKEISGRPYQKDFASLTRNYEYVWYGKFEISEQIFQKLQKDFNSFKQNL